MCKNCELSGITMELHYLEVPSIEVMVNDLSTIASWKKLFNTGWEHPDLIQRAWSYKAWLFRTKNELWINNGRAFLSALAKGFMTPFSSKRFYIDEEDDFYELKVNALTALQECSDYFGDRVPNLVWNSFAHLAVREDPEASRSILKEADSLPHHYGIVDSVLHAIPKCYKMMMYIQSVFSKHTGRILDHNCDCSCSLINLTESGTIEFTPREGSLVEMTQSSFAHLLAESHLLINHKLPFEFTVTQEAKLIPGITVR